MDEIKFNNVAKTLRKNRSLSIAQLSDRIGISPSVIQNIESGRKVITEEIVEKYMDVFDFKEEQSLILSTSSNKDISDYIDSEVANDSSHSLIRMQPVMDAKVILDTFSSCEHYGYNYDPAIMSYVSKYIKQFISTIIEYRKKYKSREMIAKFEWEQFVLESRINLSESISSIDNNKCSIFFQQSGYLYNTDPFDEAFDFDEVSNILYYPVISIVNNNCDFIERKKSSERGTLRMPSDLIIPADMGYRAYEVPN